MHLKTTCPRCHTTYQVEPALRGKHMRCPRQECRFVFEIRDADGPASPIAPPTPARHVTGGVGDLVPILQAEQADPGPAASEPLSASPEPSGPVMNPPPPPVRTRGAAPPATPRKPAPRPRPPQPAQVAPPSAAPAAVRTRGAVPPSPPSTPATAPLAPPATTQEPAPPAAPPPPPEPTPPEALSDEEAQAMLRELGLGDGAAATPPDEPAPAEAGAAPFAVADWHAGPPPRGETVAEGLSDLAAYASSATPIPEPDPTPPRRRRRSLVGIVVLLALLGGAVWGGLQIVARREAGNEADRYQLAVKRFQERSYAEAAEQFRTLARDFPQSPDEATYRFVAELADVLDPLQSVQGPEEMKRNAERLLAFVGEYRGDPRLAKYHPELHEGFRRLAREFLALADQKLDRDLLRQAAGLYEVATKYRDQPPPAEDLKRAEERIAAHELQEATVAAIKQRLEGGPSAVFVQEARGLARRAGLEKQPEVKALLDRLPAAHRASVKYTALAPAPARDDLVEESAPSLLVLPALEAGGGKARPGRRPVLALARGVLYALEPDNGQVRWAVRLGADTGTPPLWLPRDEIAPDRVLVLSSDSQALAALDAATGATRWCRRLSAPCLGAPVAIDGRAFVPTYGGRVEEIDLAGGTLVGFYDLGQPLSAGGAHQPGTHLLYLPADSFCVYVLDVAKRTCVAVLYSGHPSGSVRAAPLVVGRRGAARADGKAAGSDGYLVLGQAEGLGGVRLRVFALPVADADAEPVQQEGPLAGALWFPPWSDGEKLAAVTDAGEFVLYAIEPRADGSGPLSLLGRQRLALSSRGRSDSARAQVIHADGKTFWALTHGGLFRLRYAFTRAAGPRLNPAGHELLRPGSPLHAAQVETEEAGAVFYLVTQSPDGLGCLATAFDAHRGESRWQRQLGVVCRGQPVAIGERVLARDVGGALVLFDPAAVAGGWGSAWRTGGYRVSGRLLGDGDLAHLLATPDGAVLAVAAHRRGADHVLTVRTFAPGKEPGPPRAFTLQASLAGTPAVVGDALILPLSNGVLVRQPLAGGAATTGPTNWRAPHADEQAPGHVVALGPDQFLVTDGSRGVLRMHLDGKMWETRATAELSNRIVAPPAVLPGGVSGGPRVCVADSADTVTLLDGESLRTVRSWPSLSGRITAGPFVRGNGIGCILEGRRLVWLDPDRDRPPWPAYEFQADVAGVPQLIDGVLIAADERGRFHAIDPATGQLAGLGYAVQASAAPTAAPVPFGPDRLFAPLTDGTVLLLPRRCLRPPLLGFPILR